MVGQSATQPDNQAPRKNGSRPGFFALKRVGCGEVRDCPIDSADDWTIATQQAATIAAACGDLPSALEREVSDLLHPKVDWKEQLRDYVDRLAKTNYTWRKPNRRFVSSGLYLPSTEADRLPPLIICVDTSGSVDKNILSQFAAELRAILQDWSTSAFVIYCDSRVQATQEVDGFDCQLQPVGGGGTDFRPAFEAAENWISESGEEPTVLVYLTDLYCNRFPDQAPACPVVWAAYGSGFDRYGQPPFGEVVHIEN